MVAPALQTEGKLLQREQAVGMGATRAAAPSPAPPSADGLMGDGDSPAGPPVEDPEPLLEVSSGAPERSLDGSDEPIGEPAGAGSGALLRG